jgi:hypothetical protein
LYLLPILITFRDTVVVTQNSAANTGPTLQFYLSACAFLASLGTLIVVFYQLRFFIRQLRLNTLSKIIDANRALIRIGIEDTELLYSIESSSQLEDITDQEIKSKRYRQLFLNHVEFIWQARELNLLNEWQWSGLDEDISETFETRNMMEHWDNVKEFYPSKFQEYVDDIIKEKEQNPQN